MLVPVICGSRNVWDAAKTLLRETAPPLAKEPTEDGNLDVFGRCGLKPWSCSFIYCVYQHKHQGSVNWPITTHVKGQGRSFFK